MDCADRVPEVIDHILIQKCLEEQGFKGETGRLAKTEGIPWEAVSEIKFEFKRILRIDHLWVLPALTKLSLCNNYIERIENLESLVNLEELNLSFNKISVIENLHTLIKLETLLLYENFITCIENVDRIKKLTILNIGRNHITDKEEILSLRHHKKLQCLNMKGNPCAENEEFSIYVAVFLPQLQFFNYKRIIEDERALWANKYKDSLLRIINVELVERAAEVKLEEEQAESELHAESFVEFFNTNHLFHQMFEHNPEGKAFLSMGDDAIECYEEFRDRLLEVTMEIFEIGQQQYDIRKKEVESYMKIVNDAKCSNQKESIVEMENFIKHKIEVVGQIEEMRENLINGDIKIEDYLNNTYDFQMEFEAIVIPKVWKKLMGLEITLYEQLEVVNEIFEHTLTDMITNFIEMAQGRFAQMRVLANTYLENIGDLAKRYMASVMSVEDFILDKEMIPYVTDKDTLANALNASHDVNLQIIDMREDRLMNRAKEWLNNLVKNLQNDEITRDRVKILEINHYFDINKEEFIKAIKLDPIQFKRSEEYL